MDKCAFNHFGKCTILTDVKCSENCKFRKTEDEFMANQSLAEKRLKDKGLTATIVHTDEGPIVSVRRTYET